MEIKHYLQPLRKWLWLVVACTMVATVSSFFVTREQPLVYSTRATVMVGSAIENPNPDGNQFWLTQQLANTYADIVKRDAVRTNTMTALGMDWLPEYNARVVPGTQLIELTVIDTSPERAKAVTDELVNQLIQLSPSGQEDAQRQAFITGQLDDLEAKIEETRAELEKRQADLAGLFSARQIADTRTEITGLQDKLVTLQANYAALLSQTQAGAANSITVIEPAAVPTEPVGPPKLATNLLAAVIGMVLAGAAAYLLEYLDDSLKGSDDVQRTLGLTTLSAVPKAPGSLKGDESDLFVLKEGRSQASEAYRVLRTNLQYASVKHPVHALLITSAAPHEGKSITAANLAVTLTQAGKTVILVDTDLHRPRLHKLFALPNSAGVTTALLADELALDSILQPTHVPGLRLLSSGPLPPNPAELLDSDRMQGLIKQLKAQADMVVFDSPPVVTLADAAILSMQCDGVLMVLNARRTRRDEARRALAALKQVGARVIGVVLNETPLRRHGDYYYYNYGYARREGAAKQDGAAKRTGGFRRPSRQKGSMETDLTAPWINEAHVGGPENGTARKVKANLP